MQTKKRAKPVKFGGKEKAKKESAEEAPKVAKEEEVTESTEDKPVEEVKEVDEEKPKDEEATEEIGHVDTDEDLVEKASVDEEKTEGKSESKPDTEFFNIPPDKYDNKKSIVPYFILVTAVAFLLGLAFFYGIYYAVNSKAIKLPAIPKVTTKATVTPKKEAPTPKPVDLSAYTINILNGTDAAGLAAKLKTQLTDAGFKVGDTGNADKTDFTKTEIAAKKNVDPRYLDKLKEILKKSYQLGSVSTLASGSSDVVVTIGSASAK